LRRVVGMQILDDDIHPVRGKFQRRSGADSPAPPGDENRPSMVSVHERFPFLTIDTAM